ncbi:MAG: hypothetical protein R8N24_01505 [Alphaproteobacteria bacterium]|nr:hypothetical protein [Alphaproteobacteria bacterium]
MNKVGCFLCFSLMTVNAWATEMCARNDTIVIPLDAMIDGTGGQINDTEWLWKANFEYGTLYGANACLSKIEMMQYFGWDGKTKIPSMTPLNSSSDEYIAANGWYLDANINPNIPESEKPDYERKHCIAKMTHPVSTAWLYTGELNNIADCNNRCLNAGLYKKDARIPRQAYFQNIAIEQPK